MCDDACAPVETIPFVKKQPNTTQLCGKTCSGQNLEIGCIRSNKIITQNLTTPTQLCTNKIKLGPNIPTYDGATDGPGPITISTNAFATTTNGNNLELALNSNVGTGCIIYVGHSSDSTGTLTISNIGDPNASPPLIHTVPPGSFLCYWKSDTWLTTYLPF